MVDNHKIFLVEDGGREKGAGLRGYGGTYRRCKNP